MDLVISYIDEESLYRGTPDNVRLTVRQRAHGIVSQPLVSGITKVVSRLATVITTI
jgi:hypothetical protein